MRKTTFLVTALVFSGISHLALSDELPPGYWPPERTPEILQLTDTMRLAPNLSDLTPGEMRAVQELVEAGKIIQRIYEDQRHPQALQSFDALQELTNKSGNTAETQALYELYRLFSGPIVTTPDNRRESFLPVRNVDLTQTLYPSHVSRAQFDAYLASHPEQRDDLLTAHTVVQVATAENLKRDLAMLARYPTLDQLHPGLRRRLESLLADANTQITAASANGSGVGKHSEALGFYAIPYSLRWAPEISRIFIRLNNAARAVESSDDELARYLRNRARDLLSDDYESGDAAWLTGNFKRLNVQLGAYATDEDPLYGVKAFMSLSILKRDEAASSEANASLNDLQAIEATLPTPRHRRLDEHLSVGVYDVIADFGQARRQGFATMLPNDPLMIKRYGRTVLVRRNLLKNPQIFAARQAQWKALLTSPFDGDLSEEGEFNHSLWREVGGTLSSSRDKRNRSLRAVFDNDAGVIEGLKSNLLSLFAASYLRKHRDLSEQDQVMWFASGLYDTFNHSKPIREEIDQTTRLMQFNWFVEHGVLQLEPANNSLLIHYDRLPEAVNSMLEAVLKLQYEGERVAVSAFIERWSNWQSELHDVAAKTLRENGGGRYVLTKFSAAGE